MADFRKEGRPCPIAHRGCMEAGRKILSQPLRRRRPWGPEAWKWTSAGPGTESWWCSTMQMSGRLTMGWQGPYSSGKVKDMTWEKLSQVRLPFGGHLLKRFPEGGYSNEKQYYYPWAVAPEQEVLYQMERFESRAENEEQVLSAVYRRYKEEYERRCLEDGRLERILSLREFFQWAPDAAGGLFC